MRIDYLYLPISTYMMTHFPRPRQIFETETYKFPPRSLAIICDLWWQENIHIMYINNAIGHYELRSDFRLRNDNNRL